MRLYALRDVVQNICGVTADFTVCAAPGTHMQFNWHQQWISKCNPLHEFFCGCSLWDWMLRINWPIFCTSMLSGGVL
jgi:hypothetical protein